MAGLYLASIGPYWSISPDSATYVEYGRALASGKGWEHAPPLPPVTALLYAGVLYVFPGGYVALNAFTQLLVLTCMGLAFALLARRDAPARALLVILLSLASTSLHHASTQLLSEPAFMLVSLAALVLLERSGRLAECMAGVLLVIAAMTRTIGLVLAVAVLIVEAHAAVARRREPRTVLIVFALLAFLVVVLWDVYAAHGYLAVQLRTLVADDPWSPDPSAPSVTRLLDGIRDNAGMLAAAGGMLLNARSPDTGWPGILARASGAALLAIGLGRALRERASVTPVYVLLYVAVVSVRMLAGDEHENRFLVPVIPFLFHYALDGARHLAGFLDRGVLRPWWAPTLGAAGALYVVWFLGVGTMQLMDGARNVHSSPFGSYPIKRPGNYDAQRIALWVRDHARPQDRYASAQSDMFDLLTERRGFDIVPGRTLSPNALLPWLEEHQVRYLFVDHTLPEVRDPLLIVIRSHPARFQPVLLLPRASLYEVQPPGK